MTVVFFLRRGVDQTWVCRGILWLEFTDAFEVSRVGDNSGEFLDLFQLVESRARIHDVLVSDEKTLSPWRSSTYPFVSRHGLRR